MLRGIYGVAQAMETASRNQEIAAENLANVTTPGFRRQGTSFQVQTDANADAGGAGQNRPSGRGLEAYVTLDTGPLQQTNNPLDLAVVGEGFFVVTGPSGPLYTRNGGFERGPGGELRTRGGGYPVAGAGGSSIRIPANAANIIVSQDGAIYANGAEVGRVQVVTFDRPETMRRAGPTLFQAENPRNVPAGNIRIEQGFREGSNVQPVQEMVNMMIGLRYYEAAERAMRSLSDAITQNTRTT